MTFETQTVDVVVLGAGAAGLMAAMEAGKRGRRVVVLDHAEKIGKKILISGGGRCNFTNLGTRAENYISENPHFAKSALAAYTPQDFIALVEKHGIAYHEKTLGQLFCDGTAQRIVGMLERECTENGVRLRMNSSVSEVVALDAAEDAARYEIRTNAGVWRAESVVVATGGLSIPKMGATGFGYDVARQFGLRVTECRPALVPFTFGKDELEMWCDLAGVSTEVVGEAVAADAGKKNQRSRAGRGIQPVFREKLLITHRGLSGPAVLQVSSYWEKGGAVTFDLAPGQRVFAPLLERDAIRDPEAALRLLRDVLPSRLAVRWLEVWLWLQDGKAGVWTNAGIDAMETALHAWRVSPDGTEGYEKAEVTAGGVDTAALDARTMEARAVPGLYFIGEVVDVTGWLGGYNFQWAWASGTAAGRVA